MPKTTTNLYTITKKCVEECDKYYDISAKHVYEIYGGGKLIFGTHRCVKTCSGDFPYSLVKYCYQTCPKGTYEVTDEKNCVTDCNIVGSVKKYINDITNKCSTCDVSEGYYVPGGSPLTCYSKCPSSALYYLSLSNKCYSKGCPVDDSTQDYSDYKYLNPKTNECMNSCSGFKFNNICYSDSCPDLTVDSTNNECKCAYNYYEKNSLNICLNAGDPCPSTSP